jgi:hypothetical protein
VTIVARNQAKLREAVAQLRIDLVARRLAARHHN